MGYPKSIRAKQAAKILKCSLSHVYNLSKMGRLSRTQIGPRCYVYSYREVVELARRGF